jgi:tetratricopeptide (TPR) repeat protein
LKAAIADFIEELRDADEKMADQAAGYTATAQVLAFNNLSIAYLRQRDFLQARFWAQQALDLDPESPAAIHNRALINANLRSFHWPASPNGTYVLYVGCGRWDEIRISNASSSIARLSFQAIRQGARGCHTYPAATGELEGEIVLHGRSALYRGNGETASCRIQLQFQDATLSVEEDGQCGFGAGVHANEGDYRRISVR